jgi:ketosteroid isomerase-like protein
LNVKDPKLVALQFNECINNQDIEGLTNLMTEDHTFIDRKGEIDEGKESMTKGWINFFNQFPDYKNFFTRAESRNNIGILLGYAKWTTESKRDYAIWTAKIKNDLIAEWRIYHDTEENRKKFNIL